MAAGGGATKSHDESFADKAFGTRVLHIGQAPDPLTGAVMPPISLSTTFAQATPGMATGADHPGSYGLGFEYSRTGNPTRAAFEMAVAGAEKAKHGVAFGSGMAATTAIMHLLKTGDHVVSIDDVYGGTQRYFRKTVAPTYGMTFDFVDLTDVEKAKAAFEARKDTKLVWIETPTNPTLKVTDIAAVAEAAHAIGALVVVDNTFASPYNQNPLLQGADIVMHSVTKYINGHSDVVMGVVCTNSDEVKDKLKFIQNGVGAVPGPHDSYLALRGLKTLHLRMERHNSNALALAEYMEKHDMIEKVVYPGLASHPQHEVAKKQSVSGGFGGMVTVYVKGGLPAARAMLENFHVFTLAESLGAVESLAESPAIMTHASVPAEIRKELGLTDNLVRLSVGAEHIDDLIKDMEGALEAARAAGSA